MGGLLALESSTEDYRKAQGRLNTAFEAAGYSAETANQAYNAFYGILGDTDTATEASQLLAKLAESEEDVATWTNIAAGVSGTFGDSLPIEGLIEASNETAKVGTVTGTLADALNWAGISEDEFNAKLAACGSESERSQLIMTTLAGTYDEASEAFYRNNEALVESRNNQAQLDAVMGQLGGTVSTVKNSLLSEFLPSLSQVATGLAGIVTGTQGSADQFGLAIQGFANKVVEQLPNFLAMGTQILTSLASGIMGAIPGLLAVLPQIIMSIGTTLATLFPQVVTMGMQLLQQIAQGIQNQLPGFVATLPTIVANFVNFISENLPTFLEQGVQILNSVINGILNSIPDLVANLPQVISAFTGFVTSNLPTILRSGVSILKNLITGIIQTIPDLVASLPQIVQAIVSGIGSMMSSVINIGADIVRGIWSGISGAAGWLWNQISGWMSSIVSGIKNFFGIGSPSKLMRDAVGKWLPAGMGEGIEDDGDQAVEAAESVSKAVADAMYVDPSVAEYDLSSRMGHSLSQHVARTDTGQVQPAGNVYQVTFGEGSIVINTQSSDPATIYRYFKRTLQKDVLLKGVAYGAQTP